MSNSLPQILAILGRTEADFHVDDNQMRDRPVTWEQVLALAALVDGKRTPIAVDDAKEAVVNAARRFSDCAAEFDGDLSACGEHIDALWTAVDRLKKAEEP
jgi:hypothetical protein